MGKHYIPRLYLKGFTIPEKENCVWVFRNNDEPFQSSIKKTAQARNYYPDELESVLANDVEGPANKVILKVREKQSINQNEKWMLAKYITAMMKRVPETKEMLSKKAKTIANDLVEVYSAKLDKVSELHPEMKEIVEIRRKELNDYRNNEKVINEELAKDGWEQLIPPEATPKIIERLFQMTWLFLIARTPQNYYITSDNPVFYFPSFGIGKEYSEVSFPVSKDISLLATGRSGIQEDFFQLT